MSFEKPLNDISLEDSDSEKDPSGTEIDGVGVTDEMYLGLLRGCRERLEGLLAEFLILDRKINVKSFTHQVLYGSKISMELSDFPQELRENFTDWNKKYQQTLKHAVALQLVEEDFVVRYQNMSEEELNRDPLWNKVKDHYAQFDKSVTELKTIDDALHALAQGKEGRDSIYKVIAGVTSFTVIIPLIILLIYGVDTFCTSKSIDKLQSEKAKPESRKAKTEKLISEKLISDDDDFNSLHTHLINQTIKLSCPVFAPFKEAAKKAESEEATTKKPHTL